MKIYKFIYEQTTCKTVRLDRFLSGHIKDLSRSRVKTLILEGNVLVNGQKTTPAFNLRQRDLINVEIPEPQEADPLAENIPLSIIYEDNDLLVLDKVAGMVVHPGAGHATGTLVNALLHYCGTSLSGIGGVKRPGIVHRLDKGTSGLMVVAKTDSAHHGLSAQFSDRTLSRTYHAIIWGMVHPPKGRVDGAIARDPRHRQKMSIVAHGGKDASTLYQTCERLGHYASSITCQLETGRTHQIRVHMSSLQTGSFRHGLVMDPLYGKPPRGISPVIRSWLENATRKGDRLTLHAKSLKFIHPTSGKSLKFNSKIPEEITHIEAYLRTLYL